MSLGSLLYSVYTPPLVYIAHDHTLLYHFYADNMQLFVILETNYAVGLQHNVTGLIHCVQDMDKWMVLHKLKRNTDKFKLVMLPSFHIPVTLADRAVEAIETAPLAGCTVDLLFQQDLDV